MAADKGKDGRVPQRVVAIINPVKTRAHDARNGISAACRNLGWPAPVILETTIECPGQAQAREAIDCGADVVLVGGGDGTVRAVAGGLAHSGVPMGLIPLGTGNLLARNLRLSGVRMEEHIRIALGGRERSIDVGKVTLERDDPAASSGHVFLVLAGVGMDAQVIGSTRDVLKKNLGWLAYGEAGLRHLQGARTAVSIAIDDGPAEIREVRSVLVGNCGLIPAGISFIPGAKVDDGVLDVVLVTPATPLGWVPIAGKLLLRHGRNVASLQYHTARKVTIRPSIPLEAQLDGDHLGTVSGFSVEVAPQALMIRVGPR